MAVLHSSQRPSCSTHSMGIVSTFGMRPGVSLRGDKICTAFDRAEKFFAHECPQGVEKVPHIVANSKKKGEYCYLIEPRIYLEWLGEMADCEYWDECVQEVKGGMVRTSSGKVFESSAVILASGAYIKKDKTVFHHHPVIGESAIVKGSYGFFENIDWGDSSFVFSMNGANLVYRSWQKKIVIGGTTDAEEGGGPNREAVEGLHTLFAEFFDLPSFGHIRLGAGLRHRGRKRMPFWGELAENVYGILGLYKNGWTLSFLAAEELEGVLRPRF